MVTFTMPEHDVKLLVSLANYMFDTDEKKDEPDIRALYENAKMIFNYYESDTAVESGGSSVEYAIYDYGDRNRYIMAKFTKGDGIDENCELCWTTNLPYHECLRMVEKYDMRHWTGEECAEGTQYVVRIAYGQDLIRISSESMNKDGMTAFAEISRYIAGSWTKYQGKMAGGAGSN